MTGTDDLLTPKGSGASFGQLKEPKVHTPSPLAQEIAAEVARQAGVGRKALGVGSELTPNAQRLTPAFLLLLGSALLAVGGGALVVWVGRRRG